MEKGLRAALSVLDIIKTSANVMARASRMDDAEKLPKKAGEDKEAKNAAQRAAPAGNTSKPADDGSKQGGKKSEAEPLEKKKRGREKAVAAGKKKKEEGDGNSEDESRPAVGIRFDAKTRNLRATPTRSRARGRRRTRRTRMARTRRVRDFTRTILLIPPRRHALAVTSSLFPRSVLVLP